MITYNDIYEAVRKERYSEQLQKLPKSFVQDMADYLKEKKDIASKDDDSFSDIIIKTKKQMENAMILFKELMSRRRQKLLNLVHVASETGISRQDFENMLETEKELFEEFMKSVDGFDKALNEKLRGKAEHGRLFSMVSFNKNVEEFIGMEGEKLGPYEKGQIANLPLEIAKILVDDGKAEIIEE